MPTLNGGVDADFYNLYIGGCSLERHWAEFCSGEESYEYQINARMVRMISLREALSAEDWDIVTFQQVSPCSGIPPFDRLSLNRDGFHLSYLYGRFLAGLVWYRTLFGGDPAKITFAPEYEGEKADPFLLKMHN